MTKVNDFQSEFDRHAGTIPKWHKIDLHNHSPASFDYQGDKSTAAEATGRAILDRNLSVVMFTDHERLPAKEFLDEVRRRTERLILAGLELNVFVDAFGRPAEKVGKNLCFHLLIGFDPQSRESPEYWVQHIFRECQTESRDFGGTIVKGVRAPIEQIVDVLKGSGAILIPAHLHTSGNVYRSRSIDDIYEDAEFLRWARNSFTALDVRREATAAFFDGTRVETGNLWKTCISSSDAHRPEDLGTNPTWVQMEALNFDELRAALELPHRVSRTEPILPLPRITGIHVQGAFLPDLWLPLSPHCNVLIGVKGSGKTSVLECLRFALGTEVPRENQPKVNDHLSAILGAAGRVRLLVQRDDGARLIIERGTTDRRFRVTFDDDRELELPSPEAIRFPATILGWHEIEHAATDRQIRALHLDAIAGREDIQRLSDEAGARALRVRQMHDAAAAKYDEFLQLSSTVEKYEQMRDGLQQLEDADLMALRDQLSAGLANKTEFDNAIAHLKELAPNLDTRIGAVLSLERFAFQDKSPVEAAVAVAKAAFAKLESPLNDARGQLATRIPEALQELEGQAVQASVQFQSFSEAYNERLGTLPPEVQRLLESHRQVLEKTRELPTLQDRLSVSRFDVESALEQLRDTCEEIARLLDERTSLRRQRVAEFNAKLATSGVRLTLLEGAAKEDEYTSTLNQYRETREAFASVRARFAARGRFHRMLAGAYQDLRDDLAKGDKVIFSRAEFGYLISVLENDDLQIAFNVGKPGEPYSPIESLSAGQRCTAIFPIVLGLDHGPLVIDQPEDNLDNRHIAKTVAPRLLADKRKRQIIMTSHNANLVVLSDAEQIAVFEAEGGVGRVVTAGFLSHKRSPVTGYVLDILDGGETALQLRGKKYGLT